MHRLSNTPSVVADHDATVHVVLDDFGSAGQAYREIDPNDADEQSIVDDLISGQFERPIKIVAFNVVAGLAGSHRGPSGPVDQDFRVLRKELRRQLHRPHVCGGLPARGDGKSMHGHGGLP